MSLLLQATQRDVECSRLPAERPTWTFTWRRYAIRPLALRRRSITSETADVASIE